MFQLVRYSRWKSPLKNLKKSQSNLLFPFYISTTTTVARDESNPSRPSPPPIRVSITESAGRGVFATQAIGAGELIHTAKPIVSHPSLSTPTSVCYLCLRSLRNRTTSEAQGVSFCSHDCEEQSKVFHEVEKQADWSAYKEYCCTQGLKYPLLAKRLACMVMSGEANADSLDILQPAILSPEMISLMEKEFTLLRSAFEEAYIKDEQMAFLTKQWYVGVLARIRINAFRIELAGGLYDYEDLLSSAAALVEAEAAVGNAVYMLPSFYNHDCDPNAHIVWIENSDARVKALRDIEAGEELRICYIDASMDHDARQTLLSEGADWTLFDNLIGCYLILLGAPWFLMKVVTQLEQSISFSKIFATQSVDIILESKCGLRNRKTLHTIILRLKLAGRKVSYVNSDILFWAALSFLVLFAYPTPEVPTPSFEYHAAFSVVTLGIVSGIQQTYHQFHHENVARLFTPQLKLAAFAGRMLVGILTILLVKFCIKALAKWSLPIVANTLGIPIKSTSYIPVLSQEIPITTSNSGETLVEVKQPGYHQKLFFFSWLSSVDVDTGIRFLQYAALAWSVVALVPSLLSLLRL